MDRVAALDVLRAYPWDALVSDLYDRDDEFSGALNGLFPGTFEYPDFSHRTVGAAVKLGLEEIQVDKTAAAITKGSPVMTTTGAYGQLGGIVAGMSESHYDVQTSRGKISFHHEDVSLLAEEKLVGDAAAVHAIYEKYAESIIGDRAGDYDALEVHGVRDQNAPGDLDGTNFEIDDKNPQSFSVYAHLIEGGVDCVGDFSEHEAAAGYAAELSKAHGWAVTDHSLASEVAKQAAGHVLQDASRGEQFALYEQSPVALAFLRQIVDYSDPDRFHWAELRDADRLVAMYADTPLEKTVFSLEEDASISPENAVAYATRAKRIGLGSSLIMPIMPNGLSATEAERIASQKGEFGYADLTADRPIFGRVMGVTEEHVVLSLGRSATILEKSDLSRVPAKDEDVTIAVRDGRAIVADQRANEVDHGR